MNNNFLDDPYKLEDTYPKDLIGNIEFRVKMHESLVKDKGLQRQFIQVGLENPVLFYDLLLWANDPRRKPGHRNRPFILRPQQRVVVRHLKDHIDNGKDLVINKSRDEGATELVVKFFLLYFLFVPESQFLVGSRTEDYVDKTGDFKTIFAKIDHGLKFLPSWLKSYLNFPSNLQRNHLHIGHLGISSAIDGEATNENFGAGGRTTSIFLDEFGRVEKSLATSIKDSVNDVTNCVIYGSTHWFGTSHPFNKVVKSPHIKTVTLPWYKNPEKNQGLYTSPDLDIIEIIDIDYYRKLCPEVFNKIEARKPFTLSKLEKSMLTSNEEVNKSLQDITFIADGCEQIPGDLRSPWHDIEERRRSKRDLNQNIWMNPVGSSDMYFDSVINDRIRNSCVRPPKYVGEVEFEIKNGRFIYKFQQHGVRGRLKWWGDLREDNFERLRPTQEHNYIIGCDISLGTGTSNSVASILDVNTSEVVGEWACPDTSPEEFADQVVALCYWVGGNYGTPFLVWENNGGFGINFGRRVTKTHKYSLVYITKSEDTRRRKRKNKFGWNNSTKTKDDVLCELSIALKEGLRHNPKHKFVKIFNEDLVNELDDYMYYESGYIGCSENQDLTTGARLRHGDRVISVALTVLGMRDQPKAAMKARMNYPRDSIGFRMQQWRKEQIEDKRKRRKYLY